MSETKITDLVPQETIDKIKELNTEIQSLLTTYTQTAKELAKGIDLKVKDIGDIDKLEKLLVEKGKEAATATERLNTVISQQGQIVSNTTNTISRQLMEQERANKAQREAYTEYDKVKKLLDKFHDTYDGQISRLVQLNGQLAANKKEQKENEKALASGTVSMEQYQTKQEELIARHRALSQEKRTLTQLLAAEEKAAQSQEGSYAHMSQQLELLKKAYKELSEESRNSEFGKELEASIQNLDAHLKDMAADMGEFQRNVGNYAIANGDLKKKYEDLVGTLASLQNQYDKMSDAEKAGESGQKLAASIKEVSNAAKETKQTLDEQTKAVETAKQSIEGTTTVSKSVKRDLKELVLEIANLTIAYQSLSEEERNSSEGQELAQHIQELIEKAGVLKDAIADTNQAIANAASDTRGFDQLTGALELAINGFGLATGAAEMLGISEGELMEIQTKLQAAIVASNAVTKIQNALQKQSVLMQGANLLQTQLRTTAENIHTAAQGKGIIATKAATVAQWAFNAAANANPIGLLVVAIVACIAAVYGLVKAFEAFVGPNKDATAELKKGVKQIEAMEEAHEQLISSLERSGASQEMVSSIRVQCLNSELEAMERVTNKAIQNEADWDEIHEARDKQYKKELELLDSYEAAYFKLCNEITKQAQEDIKEREGEAYLKKELVWQEIQGQELLLEQLKALADARGYSMQQYEAILEALAKKRERANAAIDAEEEKKAEANRKKAADEAKKRQQDADRAAAELRKQVEAGEDALLNLITDNMERQRQTETLSYNRRLRDLQQQLAKTSSTQIKLHTALCRQIEGLTAEHNRKMTELEFSGHERRLKAESDAIASHLAYVEQGSEEEYNLKLNALVAEHRMELLSLDKSLANQTITVEQYEELRANLVLKYDKLRISAEQDFAAQKTKLIEQEYAQECGIQNNAYISAVNALKNRYAQELAVAQGNAEKQAEIRAKFESEQARLGEEYAERTARASIEMLEEILKNVELSDADRLKYEQELAKAKVELETAMADAAVANIERVTTADNEARQKRLENAQAWLQKASESLSAINDLASAIYDGQLEKIESQQEANEAAGEAEQERITKLVEQNVITEEEGEARKRAAEDRTAKKTEELERKKAQIKYKQAIFDKALSVANVGLNTAMALMQLWVKPGWPAAIPMMAVVGALGALQLATVLATPIPKYACGTDYHHGGPAIVGDGGRPEVVMMNGEAWLTPDTPTLVNLPVGATVYPSIVEYDNNGSNLISVEPHNIERPSVVVTNDYRKLEEKMDRVIYLFMALNRSRSDSNVNSYLEVVKINKEL